MLSLKSYGCIIKRCRILRCLLVKNITYLRVKSNLDLITIYIRYYSQNYSILFPLVLRIRQNLYIIIQYCTMTKYVSSTISLVTQQHVTCIWEASWFSLYASSKNKKACVRNVIFVCHSYLTLENISALFLKQKELIYMTGN